MGQLGLGVMINMLGGNERTVEAVQQSLGKTIAEMKIEDNALLIGFNDATVLKLWDDGQSCCESRYMNCDDDLTSFGGAKLVSVELRDGGSREWDGDEHDVEFLVVVTDQGDFTVANHVEHNGYYGGFSVTGRVIEAPKAPAKPTRRKRNIEL